MFRRIVVLVALFSLLLSPSAFAALNYPTFDDVRSKPTTTSGYGITDALTITGSQSPQNKTFDSTNSVDGAAIDTGTVSETVIDSTIARDSEIPNNASFTFSGSIPSRLK